MVHWKEPKAHAGFILLGVLLTAIGCRTPGDSSSTTAGATPPDRSLVEVADVPMARSAEKGSAEVSGDEGLSGVYVAAISECLIAGRMTFHDLQIRLTGQEWYSSWAAIDGRLEDATPVRIKAEDLGEMRTEVLFTVGTRKSDYDKAMVRALKEGFEKRLLIATPRDH